MKKIRNKYITLTLFCVLCSVSTSFAIPVEVDVTRQRSINGQLTVNRKNLFNVHAGTSGFTSAQQQYLYEDLDVYAGRSFGVQWKMRQISEDTGRPGYWDLNQMNSTITSAYNSWVSAGSPPHDNTTDKITTSHTDTHYPSAEDIAAAPPNGFRTRDHDANAEFVSKYIQMFYPRMTWYEFSNEINGQADELGTTWTDICTLAKTIADRVHADSLGTKFVGFGGKWPAFEVNNFGIWNRDWVPFIDIAGVSMDGYSVHLYSRMGPNAEAIMDMINNYSKIQIDETKPLMITEFGHLPDMTGTLEEKMWQNIRGQNSFFFQFLERGGLMGRSIPFNTASNPTWASAMLVEEPVGSGTYVWSDMIKLYEFWKDFRGERLEVSSGDPDVLAHALQDGSTVRFAMYNTLDSSVDVEPDYLTGDATINSAQISRLYWGGTSTDIITDAYFNPVTTPLTLSGYEAVILTLNLSGVPSGQTENEKLSYFGDSMIQPISASTPITINMNGLDTSKNMLKARLRLSAGNITSWFPSSILVNGTPVTMPTDQMSSPTENLRAYEVEVPVEVLSLNNVISVTYATGGGHLAGAVMDITYGVAPIHTPYSGTPISLPGKLQAEEYDLGNNGVAYYDTTAGNNGGDFRSDDVDITDQYGGYVVAWVTEEEWLKYTVDAAAGTYDITVRASTGITNRNVTLTLDGNVLGSINIPNMGWSTFGAATLTDVVIPATSSGILQLTFNGGVNVDWIDFTLLKGDVDFSGTVGSDDLYLLASQWLSDCLVEEACADLDYSGKVDYSDFTILSGGWMMP